MMMMRICLPALAALVLVACNQQEATVPIPGPFAMTEEAVGHYCNMNILEHTGPKAQIHLKGMLYPVWFSQVRDGIAFTRSPEEHYEAVAIYVNDMGRATEWDFPGDDTWINVDDAWFVIGSSKIGGMGAPEVIPFRTQSDATTFAVDHGGDVVRLADIPNDYVLGPVDLKRPSPNSVTGAIQ